MKQLKAGGTPADILPRRWRAAAGAAVAPLSCVAREGGSRLIVGSVRPTLTGYNSVHMLRYQDVFVPGGLPLHTYNPRAELQLEERLAEAKDNLSKLVTVTGQTKSGKTVLARKVFRQNESVWIDGGLIRSEDDFWQTVVDRLGLFGQVQEGTASDVTSTISGEAAAGANFVVVKGTGKTAFGRATKRGTSATKTRSLPPRVIAVRALLDRRIPVVIDDFHYIARDLQGDIIRALKPVIFDGVPVVIIAIPHRRYDAVKVEKEMTGRIAPINIPNWSEPELRYIPETGFSLLNYEVHVAVAHRLGSQAIGSPHLMQEFCRGIGKLHSVQYSDSRRPLNVRVPDLEAVFTYVAETIGRPIFEKLAKGPNTRRDRIQRYMKSGRKVDIYELVLHALAEIGPGLTSIEYEDLRAAMRDISDSQIPQINEVSRVLKHMDRIAATDESSSPVIDYEDHDRKLHITDPFFAFYLRWGELARRDENGAA